MKLLLYFFLFGFLTLTITSCDKDDDPVIDGNLVGVWRTTQVECDNGVSSYTFEGIPITTSFSYFGKDFAFQTTFTENPNEFFTTGSYTVVTTTTTFGQSNTVETSVTAFPGTGTWAINGNQLTQVFAGETTTFEILELSNTTLRIKGDYNVQLVDNGITITNTFTVFSTFERI